MDKRLSLLVKFAGLDQLTGKMRSIGAAGKKTAKDLGETRKEIDRLRQAQARIGGYRDLETRFQKTSAALDEQRAKLAQLRREQEAAGEGAKGFARKIATAERAEQRLIALQEKHGAELQQLGSKLDAAGVDVADLARDEDRLGLKLYETNKQLKRQAEELERVGRQRAQMERVEAVGGRLRAGGATAIGGGVAAALPVVGATKGAMGFEESMAEVRKVVDFKDDGEFRKMGRDILTLSRTLPIAADEVAQIVAAGGQANIPRKELLLFARDAGTMAVAFDTTADSAGDMMAKWRSAFSLDRAGVLTLANQVNYLGNTTAAGTESISDMVTRVGALGDVAGLKSGQIAAMAATLGSMGIQSEVAATGIKNTLLALTKGEAATKSQREAYAALGLTAQDVAKRMQIDSTGTIVDVLTRIRSLPKEAQAGQLTELFGAESVAAIAPMLTQLDALKNNFMLAADASKFAGSMQAEFDTRASTSANKVTLLRNRLSAAKITLGDKLLPSVVQFAEWAGAAADKVSAWADRNPELASGLMKAAAVLTMLVIGVGAMSLAIGTVIGPAFKLFSVFTSGFARLAVLFATNPMLLLVAGVAVAAFLIWKHWDKIKAAFKAGLDWLRGLWADFKSVGGNLIQGLIDGVTAKFAAVKNTVMGLARRVIGWFKTPVEVKSPSRVFMRLGNYLTEGLALGVDRGATEPIERMKRLAGQMTMAIAAGSAMGASPAAAQPGSAGAAGGIRNYYITVQQQPGQSAQDLARIVADEIDRRDRERAAAARSEYRDD